jgi:centromere protein I
VSSFLKAYLSIWNGQDNRESILVLLAHVPFESFQDAYVDYFQIAEQSIASQGLSGYEAVITLYTHLLQQQVSTAVSEAAHGVASDSKVFQDLAAHVSTLSMSLLVSIPMGQGQTLVSAVLSFYELLASCSIPHIVPIVLPSMHLVYFLTQHASSTTFSRTCGIIGSYKNAFDQHPKPVKEYYPTHVTDSLNWCLRDIYHLVWISRALVAVDNKAMGLYCDSALRSTLSSHLGGIDRDYAIGSAFGLSHHACLASLSAVAWRVMEEREIEKEGYDKSSIRYHQGPVGQRSLEVLKKKGGVSVNWDGADGYKVFALNWFADRGLAGMRNLMFTTVADLRGKV